MELDDQDYDNAPTTSAINSTNLTILSADHATVVAEQLGITEISDQVTNEISAHVSYVMKIVLTAAKKFQTCGRRKMMTADDVDGALIFFGLSPQFGYEISGGDRVPFRLAGSMRQDLYIRDDPEIELSALTKGVTPRLPLETSIKSHWLVIDGLQPAVPENPAPKIKTDGTVAQLNGKLSAPISRDSAPLLLNQFSKMVRKTEQVHVKTHTTTHALSLEQQVFFKEITEAIMGGDEPKRMEALHCLQYDCGLHALLPRISITIHEGVRCNIVTKNLAILIYLMRMIQSLLANENVSIERCLHELLPSIMSCILSRQLCTNLQSDNHWALRGFSAKLLERIAERFKHHPTLRSRITNELARPLHDENCALATCYGALYALNLLGEDTIRTVVLPEAHAIRAILRRISNDNLLSAAEDKIRWINNLLGAEE